MSNVKYKSYISVEIDGTDHVDCLTISRLVTKLCDAWSFQGVRYDEYKSQKKKPVTRREIMIYQTGYAHDVIIFREALRCILSFQLFTNKVIIDCRTEPVLDDFPEAAH